MNGRACLAAALLAACDGAPPPPPPPPPPDLTAPRIANPVNPGVGRTDVLRVRFSEPVRATEATAVRIAGLSLADIPAVVTLTADGVLEVAPLAPLGVPDTVRVTVRFVADAAGNLLVEEAAEFQITGWLDLGLDSGPVHGPASPWHPDIASRAGVTQVVWPLGRAFLEDGTWSSAGASPFSQRLVVDGIQLLRLTVDPAAGIAIDELRGAETSPFSSPLSISGPVVTSLAGCGPAQGKLLLAAWQETVLVGAPWSRVRAARNLAGGWADAGVVGGAPGQDAWRAQTACSQHGTYFVALEQAACDGGPCVRLMGRAQGEATWSERLAVPLATNPAVVTTVDLPTLAYAKITEAGTDLRVTRLGATWADLGGPLDVVVADNAVEPALALATDGALVAAWNEYPAGDLGRSRVFVKTWDGKAWALLGGGPVNDEAPLAAGWSPRLSLGAGGEVLVAYLEWDGTGQPMDETALNYRVRVKRLVR